MRYILFGKSIPKGRKNWILKNTGGSWMPRLLLCSLYWPMLRKREALTNRQNIGGCQAPLRHCSSCTIMLSHWRKTPIAWGGEPPNKIFRGKHIANHTCICYNASRQKTIITMATQKERIPESIASTSGDSSFAEKSTVWAWLPTILPRQATCTGSRRLRWPIRRE